MTGKPIVLESPVIGCRELGENEKPIAPGAPAVGKGTQLTPRGAGKIAPGDVLTTVDIVAAALAVAANIFWCSCCVLVVAVEVP
jgi:hypothetical protein